ncbi:DUF2857 domain-containing protein [Pseudomonas aeruginosa]|uniref:DUF2857 domain-containing protein n=1 Tax=Pseudomonas aeruginosa TaxID=287 RepID=UPI0018C7653B|nr:DUF2857 domain-containing protein [Pseudomonas aeruginosa]HBP6126795.1 DUF2857 domain-containing protein [Pseudomonas aeruginosa]HBP6242146.1 DUF2857 domain-containing protein [Pseudomonas aeruginosa]
MSPPHPLNQAVVAQALHDLRNGQLRRCKSMGFGDEELEALMEPAMASALANALVSWCSVSVNGDVFKRLVKQAREAEFDMTVVDRMLRLGASTAMVGKFHGLTHQDVARRRELLGLPKRRGRHRVLDEKQDTDLWAQWKVMAKARQVDTADVVAVLEIAMDLAEGMSLPLSVIWTTLTGWLYEGQG